MEKNITIEMIKELINAYESNKDSLYKIDEELDQKGVLDDGTTDIHNTYEMGYNNAMQHVFSILGIDYEANPSKYQFKDKE